MWAAPGRTIVAETTDGWFVRHAAILKTAFRVTFGVIWGLDAVFKFDPALVGAFPQMIADAGEGQPAWR